MNKTILVLTLIFVSPMAFATDYISYDCQLRVTRENKPDFVMSGLVRIAEGDHDTASYLTLEPPTLAALPVSARVLLTRYDGDLYFPMSLHPRGETVNTLSHTQLQGKEGGRLKHVYDGNLYHFVCAKRSSN